MTGYTKKPATARFALGDVTRTTAAQRAIKETAGVTTVELVCRHMGGDWGVISGDARLVNGQAHWLFEIAKMGVKRAFIGPHQDQFVSLVSRNHQADAQLL